MYWILLHKIWNLLTHVACHDHSQPTNELVARWDRAHLEGRRAPAWRCHVATRGNTAPLLALRSWLCTSLGRKRLDAERVPEPAPALFDGLLLGNQVDHDHAARGPPFTGPPGSRSRRGVGHNEGAAEGPVRSSAVAPSRTQASAAKFAITAATTDWSPYV
jgi:hypothetical protein